MDKPFIGLEKVWYGDVITTVAAKADGYTAAELKALLPTLKEVKNVHQDTWGYNESDPTVQDYINELTGLPYYRDITQAAVPTISFTLGQYAMEDKAALQGGSVKAGAWERGAAALVEKCIVAKTKTGNYIVFPKANIVGKGALVQKNIGLGVSAVPIETGVEGLASEKWFPASVME